MITLRFSVLFAERILLKISTRKLKHVPENAVQNYVGIKSIKYVGKADVYNMEVRNHHNFSVCGGFIIHNCCDALRYAVMTAWKQIKHWLPAETEEKVLMADIMRKEVEEENGYF